MKKNVIMGVSKGYGWWEVEPFLTSWKKNASNADMVLFVDDTSAWTRKCLSITTTGGGNKNLRLIEIPAQFKDKQIVNIRWSIYKNFLEAHSAEYNQILLTDVRDVIFQGDAFAPFQNSPMYFCYATEGNLIEKSDFNRQWLINVHGKEVFEQIKKRFIICAGTIMATCNEMMLFLSKMESAVGQNNAWGSDQATLNYFVYCKQLPINNIIESNIVKGPILTLAWQNTGTLGNSMINLSREVPPVVHMYTSHPPLIQLVNKLYRSPQLTSIDGINDVNSILDFVNAIIWRGGLPLALTLMLQTLDKHPAPKDWHNSFSHLERIFNTTLAITPQIFHTEIIEQSVCCAFLRVFNGQTINPSHLDKMFMLLVMAKQKYHTIYKPFENFLCMITWQSMKIFEQQNDLQKASGYIERMEKFDHAFGDDFYFTAAEINRKIGHKDKALEYYKRLLERSA